MQPADSDSLTLSLSAALIPGTMQFVIISRPQAQVKFKMLVDGGPTSVQIPDRPSAVPRGARGYLDARKRGSHRTQTRKAESTDAGTRTFHPALRPHLIMRESCVTINVFVRANHLPNLGSVVCTYSTHINAVR